MFHYISVYVLKIVPFKYDDLSAVVGNKSRTLHTHECHTPSVKS